MVAGPRRSPDTHWGPVLAQNWHPTAIGIVATALHAAPTNTRKVSGLFFAGLFDHSTTVQKPMLHHRFGYICQMILASMINIFSPGFRHRAYMISPSMWGDYQ